MGMLGVNSVEYAYQNSLLQKIGKTDAGIAEKEVRGFQTFLEQAESQQETDGEESLMVQFKTLMSEMAEKIKNGDTEPAFQIGGQSFTQKQWENLMQKVDKSIEDMQEEQEVRAEKQKAEADADAKVETVI